LLVHQGLAAGDRHQRGAALLGRRDRLLDRHALAQRLLRVLDLPAARTAEVALEQGLELDEQREPLATPDLLRRPIARDGKALPKRDAHAVTSLGSLKCSVSTISVRSSTSTLPSERSA